MAKRQRVQIAYNLVGIAEAIDNEEKEIHRRWLRKSIERATSMKYYTLAAEYELIVSRLDDLCQEGE